MTPTCYANREEHECTRREFATCCLAWCLAGAGVCLLLALAWEAVWAMVEIADEEHGERHQFHRL